MTFLVLHSMIWILDCDSGLSGCDDGGWLRW